MLQTTDHLDPSLTADLEAQLGLNFPLRRLDLAGGQQALRECGRGPAIVLLHGIGSGAASWLAVAQLLGQRARVIAWDAPGYGQSSPLRSLAPDASDYAGRLGQMLDALGVERCVLVGHSLGAITATAFASGAQQQRVSRLVLISPAQGYGHPSRQAQGRAVRKKRLADLEHPGIQAMARQRSACMLSPGASPGDHAWVRWNMAQLNPEGYRQAIELLCGEDLLRQPPLSMPCDVHCGAADGITTPDSCQLLARALGASFSLMTGAGHASPIEQPYAVAGRLALAIEHSLTGASL
ncbi:alpha/beta fold hydrolase [Pseudomonas fragi]|uniref:alpha/beta fold hydrolase n=1 Tax=Pseudomonas fragi TaxID=296 RepID=UPI0003007879|nr:alpha/beta hydrolase [Pseudomonas fragi]MDE4513632.1 alpha/beta hydrolase [Pseudomonas fragi]QPC37095.1 alpha/beta hydrolase [Pseudomonas fragi]SDU26610.1 Pimeloyl-ACP methyl ester carboxylesterase [Pseudomonas fragi]